MAIKNITDDVKLLREIALRARLVCDKMRISSAGDQYVYEGPVGDLDGLRDSLEKLDWGSMA